MKALRTVSHPLADETDLNKLIAEIGDKRFVLLGEASHGTKEYYEWRTAITKRLIEEKSFNFIAVEGDWPDCYTVNEYIKGEGEEQSPSRVLKTFNRWPTWLWANREFGHLVTWLREYNDKQERENEKVGFYGLDVYSLWDSLTVVTKYLAEKHPELIEAVRKAYECLEPHGLDMQQYAYATAYMSESCEAEVVDMLVKFRQHQNTQVENGLEQHFNAEQNALVVKNAENYYRVMLHGGAPSWNVRDRHMVETLNRLVEHHGRESKVIVWEHNTHVGDARATDMAGAGMVNVGQLVREKYGDENVYIVGFGSYEGTVIAAKAWDDNYECMKLPPAIEDSWEWWMHEIIKEDSILFLRDEPADSSLREVRGNRAVGVVYNPLVEVGNYVPTRLANRYDAFIHLEKTNCLTPYHYHLAADHDLPETFPTGV